MIVKKNRLIDWIVFYRVSASICLGYGIELGFSNAR